MQYYLASKDETFMVPLIRNGVVLAAYLIGNPYCSQLQALLELQFTTIKFVTISTQQFFLRCGRSCSWSIFSM